MEGGLAFLWLSIKYSVHEEVLDHEIGVESELMALVLSKNQGLGRIP